MSDGPWFTIAANRITPQQREQIHGIVKEHANGWWHGFADLWIVGGKSASEWRDLVGVAVPHVPSGVLVFKVDSDTKGTWAYRAKMNDNGREWIKRYL